MIVVVMKIVIVGAVAHSPTDERADGYSPFLRVAYQHDIDKPRVFPGVCYTILYYTILYCTVLYCTILFYIILYCTVQYYTILYYTILYCTVLYYTIMYYTIL